MTALPVFKTKRLILKGITEEDALAYTEHFVDYEVISQLAASVPWPYPEGGVLSFIKMYILPHQGKDKWVWGLFLKETPVELIGAIDLWRKCNPENRGFWLGKKFWGQGLMTEAVVPVTDYAFSDLNFDKLVFSNALGNVRSRRIKEKTGARFVRTEPAKSVNPAYTEREVWELTKEEWVRFRDRHPDGA
jgi:RimJ/RimL family protein N-acetyltransferase